MSQFVQDACAGALALWSLQRAQCGPIAPAKDRWGKWNSLVGKSRPNALRAYLSKETEAPGPLDFVPVVTHGRCQPSNIATLSIVGELGFGRSCESIMGTVAGAVKIILELNSPGGDSLLALRLHDALKLHPDVEVEIERAGSCCAILAQSGRIRRISANGSMMIHAPCMAALGTTQQLHHAAAVLEGIEERFISILCERSGQPIDVVSEWMSTDTHFTAHEALAVGLVDQIYG